MIDVTLLKKHLDYECHRYFFEQIGAYKEHGLLLEIKNPELIFDLEERNKVMMFINQHLFNMEEYGYPELKEKFEKYMLVQDLYFCHYSLL